MGVELKDERILPLTRARKKSLDEIRFREHVIDSLAHQEESLAHQEAKIQRLIQLLRAYLLRPGAGRPRHPNITRAAKMKAAGKSWREIFKVCLPDSALFNSTDTYKNAKRSLRSSVKLREKRALASQQLPDAKEAKSSAAPATNSA